MIELNVRGETLKLNKKSLSNVEGSALEAMFSGRHNVTQLNERPFVDRDPEIFKHILYFLENNRLPTIQDKEELLLLDQELDYWALPMPSAEL